MLLRTLTNKAIANKTYIDIANEACKNNSGATLSSVHSLEEQWFIYHLYMSTLKYTTHQCIYIGGKRDLTVNATSDIKWFDNSPVDYHPEWGYWNFQLKQPNKNTSMKHSLCIM